VRMGMNILQSVPAPKGKALQGWKTRIVPR
jgi:hypothetical protein